MSDYQKTYVSSNNRPGAPDYDPHVLEDIYQNVVTEAPELKLIGYPALAAVAIGAHRADIVPELFETSIDGIASEDDIKVIFNQFRSVIMIVWPFIGIPWCVPAALGLVASLKSRGIEKLPLGRQVIPDICATDKVAGDAFRYKAYKVVPNGEVQEMLRTYFQDFAELGWTVVFGYSLQGTADTGIFKDYETQLILSAAVAASGATRQARSLGQGAVGMGNSTAAVKALFEAAEDLNAWNGTKLTHIDVEA